MHLHTLTPRGPFSLVTSSSFLCGFAPASGTTAASDDGLALGFLSDDGFVPSVARVRERGSDVVVETSSPSHTAQVARMLSLDVDASPLADLAAREPVVGRLAARRPGFRPTVFPSAYEAAVWGVLAQRIPMRVASAAKVRLSEATGSSVSAFGRTFHPAPPPRALLGIRSFPGLPEEKLARLHGVARAAERGELDTETLRRLPEEEALARLERLRGVGAWTSRHVLLRGCGTTDALTTVEPRVLRAVGDAYGLGRTATADEVARIAEGWRPLRTWISILLVWELASTPRWHGPEPRGEVRRQRAARTASSTVR